MPRGFLVKRRYIDTFPLHARSLSEDYSDHSSASSATEDAPTDLSKPHTTSTSPPIIHPYPPPISTTLFQPQLDFHSLVVERLQQRLEPHPLCLYPDAPPTYHDYLLPPLYHQHHHHHHHRPPSVSVPAAPASACTPGAAGGLLLDLSIKASTPITPPATPSPVTSAAAPSTKRQRTDATNSENATPDKKPSSKNSSPLKKIKAVRRLHFDEDKSSPVSGTIIRELGADEPPLVVRKGDIDPAFNVVEVTEEAKAELAKIENHIGDYICRLCREMYDDAFSLAQHRCSRIVHVEYRCPECDKVFNCPANLASHRRWHKPRPTTTLQQTTLIPGAGAVDLVKRQSCDSSSSGDEQEIGIGSAPLYPCDVCHKRFRRQAYLKKHVATHSNIIASVSPPPQQPPGLMCAPPPPIQPPPLLTMAD